MIAATDDEFENHSPILYLIKKYLEETTNIKLISMIYDRDDIDSGMLYSHTHSILYERSSGFLVIIADSHGRTHHRLDLLDPNSLHQCTQLLSQPCS